MATVDRRKKPRTTNVFRPSLHPNDTSEDDTKEMKSVSARRVGRGSDTSQLLRTPNEPSLPQTVTNVISTLDTPTLKLLANEVKQELEKRESDSLREVLLNWKNENNLK